MNKLTLPLRLAALLAMLVSCGPTGQDIKVARDTHYKGDPAALYAAMHLGVPATRALAEVTAALPDAALAPFLHEAVLRIAEAVATVGRALGGGS